MSTGGEFPVQHGATVGSGAFVLGLLVTLIIGLLGLHGTLALVVGFAPVSGTILGFSTLHLWPLIVSSSSMGGLVPLTIVPLVILVAGGYLVASRTGRGNGFVNGASVVVGYLALTLVAYAYLIFLASGRTGMTIDLDVLLQILFTGVLYPAVFGGIGGILADSA